jgi:hypothetical protein
MYASYADDGKTLGGSVHTLRENAESLIVSIKEIGLEVNADKTKEMVMSRDHSGRRIRNLKIYNISFEMEEEIKYLETNLPNQNSFQE